MQTRASKKQKSSWHADESFKNTKIKLACRRELHKKKVKKLTSNLCFTVADLMIFFNFLPYVYQCRDDFFVKKKNAQFACVTRIDLPKHHSDKNLLTQTL